MGGRLVERIWEANLERDTPVRYRKASGVIALLGAMESGEVPE